MAQYFVIANLDKKEYIELSLKLWEICANNDARILPYLLATNNPDGVSRKLLTSIWAEQEVPEGWEHLEYFDTGKTVYRIIKKKTKYFGRWCGDRIAVIGDYSDMADNNPGISYHYVLEHFKNITKEAVEEFNEFIEDYDLQIRLLER